MPQAVPRRQPSMRRAGLVALSLLAGACAMSGDMAGDRSGTTGSIAASPEAVRARFVPALRQMGFTVVQEGEQNGRIVATTRALSPAAAYCRRVIITDTQSDFLRSDWSSARSVSGEVVVELEPAAGATAVRISTDLTGLYHDRYRNLPVSRPCPSTGELERRLLTTATTG